eukprot:2064294-Pyramimonas_sp.AAC.1
MLSWARRGRGRQGSRSRNKANARSEGGPAAGQPAQALETKRQRHKRDLRKGYDDDETTKLALQLEQQQYGPVWQRHPRNLLQAYTLVLWPQHARACHRICAQVPPQHRGK